MSFLGIFKFENLVKEVRDKWQKNKLMRFRLRADGSVDMQNMLPNEPDSMWELFNVNERMHGQRYCILWIAGSNDNNYIKCQKVGDDDMVLSDTPVAVLLDNDFEAFD